MKKNMGLIDRIIRLIVAFILLTLVAVDAFPKVPNAIAIVVATVFILTAVSARCPLYRLLNISTCARNTAEAD